MAEYSGDESYQRLIVNVYGYNKDTLTLLSIGYEEYKFGINPSSISVQIPLFFVRGGYYNSNSGLHGYKEGRGYYWEKSSYSNEARSMYLVESYISTIYHYNKGRGFSVRWGAK